MEVLWGQFMMLVCLIILYGFFFCSHRGLMKTKVRVVFFLRTLAGKSQQGVNKLLRRSNRHVSSSKKEQNDFKTNEQEVVHTMVAQNASKAEDCSSYAVGSSRLEVDTGTHQDTLFDDSEDMNDSDWEHDSIPKMDPVDHSPNETLNGLTIEFNEPSGSAGRKPVRRASAEDKESAELVHKVHLLCLLVRGRLIDNACDDRLIQASLLSLLPTHLSKISEASNITAKALSPLVTWIAALSVALFRALKFTARFVSILDVSSSKPEADKYEPSSKEANRVGGGIFSTSTLMVANSEVSIPSSPVKLSSCNEKNDCGENSLRSSHQRKLEPLHLPHAVDGIVPKNERGQVEVWSEKCLPPGTVHIRLPRVFSVAKKLEIDYAPAMVGFVFRNGRAAPVFDGMCCKDDGQSTGRRKGDRGNTMCTIPSGAPEVAVVNRSGSL
ncbi:hypothetical protein REPUB_Repub12eG0013900 [Reevesia pubescens]